MKRSKAQGPWSRMGPDIMSVKRRCHSLWLDFQLARYESDGRKADLRVLVHLNEKFRKAWAKSRARKMKTQRRKVTAERRKEVFYSARRPSSRRLPVGARH